jgi:hypothetical protein
VGQITRSAVADVSGFGCFNCSSNKCCPFTFSKVLTLCTLSAVLWLPHIFSVLGKSFIPFHFILFRFVFAMLGLNQEPGGILPLSCIPSPVYLTILIYMYLFINKLESKQVI